MQHTLPSSSSSSAFSQLTASANVASGGGTCPRLRHILTGTFNTLFLHLLTFDSLTRSLTLTLSIPARGPHQYLTLGSLCSEHERVVYATTWSDQREVSAWSVSLLPGSEQVRLINARQIISAGSYVAVQPPPFESRTSPAYGVRSSLRASSDGRGRRSLYQAGGPTGEVFSLNPDTGAIEGKEQQLIFLKGGEEALRHADKSRRSLRYGAHNVDFDVNGLAYIADLGQNAILIYSRDPTTGRLTHLSTNPSPEAGDGPRHVVPSPCGRWVFSVTEHNSYADAYRVVLSEDSSTSNTSSSTSSSSSASSTFNSRSPPPAPPRLEHKQRLSLLPANASRADYRGDTIRLSPDGRWLFATTRGMTASTRGLVRAWKVDLSDLLDPFRVVSKEGEEKEVWFWTPTSGGKANAWEWAPRYPLHEPFYAVEDRVEDNDESTTAGVKDWAVLTDDEQGFVLVMQWDGRDLIEVARAQLPGVGAGSEGGGQGGVGLKEGEREGASHAIWLS